MNEEPKPFRYVKGALRYLKDFEFFEGILTGLRSFRRYLKGASTKGTLSLCRKGRRGGRGEVNEEPKPS